MLSALDPRAVRDALPLFVPAIPFGFVLGLAIAESAIPDAVGFTTSPLVFAGAAQLALVSLAGTTTLWAAAATPLVINLRHVMYSAAMAPAFARQPRWFRWLAPFVLIDQVFALTSLQTDLPPNRFRRYYLTCGAIFFIGWNIVTLLGLFLGGFVPSSWGLDYAPAVMFAGIVVMMLDRRPSVIAAVVAAVVCFSTLGLPNRLGLLVGALAGVTAGVVAERPRSATQVRRGSPA